MKRETPTTRNQTRSHPEIEDLWTEHYDSTVRAAQRVVRRQDLAEEIAQQVFLTYLERDCQPTPGKEGAYLRRMASNLALTFVRRQKVEDRHMAAFMPVAESAEDQALRRVESERMRSHIAALPARQRTVITCQHLDGLSERETAKSLGISAGSIKTHGHRARSALRDAYQAAA